MEDVKKQSETLRDDVVTQEELDHAERVVGEFGGTTATRRDDVA